MNRHNILALTLLGVLPDNVALVHAPEPDRISDEDLARQATRAIQAPGAPRNREQRREQERRERRNQTSRYKRDDQ
ncbi:hypothetical protein [Deinococcus soli (ex Cha et al. 2016)]|uniref:Uncharacterized protein n=2 Tax=Deinococcus soli (ex Cha et al. 2016) TaxID=1309411 RepID=A0AAE3XBU2_9DEIO|nr:hypothetical protein [Deinococcus soli (ex Cha et al. 2016)]MDR6218622.1 hypothetical protein [Deinococcus soli (ex Cha et al. 2016)]MDR6328419.1 hypothetical protein [Deinococcus soli (ex Cha et al. 2016)]MDR6753030.1 hypothetical protein [Deinococcus soli (ex Cha et al. 2016)]